MDKEIKDVSLVRKDKHSGTTVIESKFGNEVVSNTKRVVVRDTVGEIDNEGHVKFRLNNGKCKIYKERNGNNVECSQTVA